MPGRSDFVFASLSPFSLSLSLSFSLPSEAAKHPWFDCEGAVQIPKEVLRSAHRRVPGEGERGRGGGGKRGGAEGRGGGEEESPNCSRERSKGAQSKAQEASSREPSKS